MIKNIINNKEYELIIRDKFIHIKNYVNISSISNNRIEILLNEKVLIINGSSLIIKCMDEYELVITGIIKEIEFNE